MKIIEKDNNSNAGFGVVLEESASTLTQGPGGRYFEGLKGLPGIPGK